MKLFERIPERLFSILTSSNKELYVEALFVLRQAFKTELVIRRIDLVAMMIDAMEVKIIQADFSEEAEEMDEGIKVDVSLSGKAYLIIRKLKETGWLEVEYQNSSFEEDITIPDYAISIINLLYDISTERMKEYNSYVFATYSALKNTEENPDYMYQALQAAYQNTVQLVDELKLLFNNIRRYYQRMTTELNINELLAEHFDYYKEQIIDNIYYPLKTIDSVPRFKHAILLRLNEWVLQDEVIEMMVMQGKKRRIYTSEEEGKEDILEKINYIANTFENIEGMIAEIDKKHVAYTNASIDRIRYMMNSDRSVKGKLVELLKQSDKAEIYSKLSEGVLVYQQGYIDDGSLYNRTKRTVKSEGKPTPIEEIEVDNGLIDTFLEDIRKQYSFRKINEFVLECFSGKDKFCTEDMEIRCQEEFILLILATFQTGQRNTTYCMEFLDGTVEKNGYRLPKAIFNRKGLENSV
ncbi:hypothetical protein HYG86_14710 [Alkalicella caledoniensis]|uniref:Uncharacterized protein n=1 Tax=Alkalicella caledoniensis TaxID=2731377 RepID=A0A7G9WB67_ALKCA|nr:Wadjet anti-phage system protein JetA family protein [Alkalicella caledoniensis]QNO15929.1 hypothetical protein HYG86_14710 [Alkalicella caledoniensis]